MGELRGLRISEILARCGAAWHSIDFLDEPPGRLRAIAFDCPGEGGTRLVVELAGDRLPFSEARNWSEREVGTFTAAAVRRHGTGSDA
jgi:hypothetical protein